MNGAAAPAASAAAPQRVATLKTKKKTATNLEWFPLFTDAGIDKILKEKGYLEDKLATMVDEIRQYFKSTYTALQRIRTPTEYTYLIPTAIADRFDADEQHQWHDRLRAYAHSIMNTLQCIDSAYAGNVTVIKPRTASFHRHRFLSFPGMLQSLKTFHSHLNPTTTADETLDLYFKKQSVYPVRHPSILKAFQEWFAQWALELYRAQAADAQKSNGLARVAAWRDIFDGVLRSYAATQSDLSSTDDECATSSYRSPQPAKRKPAQQGRGRTQKARRTVSPGQRLLPRDMDTYLKSAPDMPRPGGLCSDAMNLLLAEQSTQELLGLMLQASNVLASRADTQPAEIISCVAKLIKTMAKVHAKSVATADSASSTVSQESTSQGESKSANALPEPTRPRANTGAPFLSPAPSRAVQTAARTPATVPAPPDTTTAGATEHGYPCIDANTELGRVDADRKAVHPDCTAAPAAADCPGQEQQNQGRLRSLLASLRARLRHGKCGRTL